MNVRELIKLLDAFDPNLPVVYSMWSEQCLLETSDLRVQELCEARPDGWVAHARPDKPLIPYLNLTGG